MYTLENLIKTINENQVQRKVGNQWVPARPLPFDSFWYRLRDAWEVFRGRADAVQWPGGQ